MTKAAATRYVRYFGIKIIPAEGYDLCYVADIFELVVREASTEIIRNPYRALLGIPTRSRPEFLPIEELFHMGEIYQPEGVTPYGLDEDEEC